ncbi:stage V sporulation protein AD [Ureibacillus sp. FSL K6-8385]|uniref:Stage V sporulation protein AD n=1 Tax=Ureibacillus terrenus TaxID=118246 RepID=A0A540V3Q7_9BACL|nr:stage V sporulation protein AD [Ureibacillus terrenus]MED3661842.1 stage V sporulation protein AD [Ureibacillus terrenus]MED3763145.1 stage V sporulation protein AD [Ureibacillus terrenus]TQE91348.1 stage V sporulation protein AD [Ureibacillus terrenus]
MVIVFGQKPSIIASAAVAGPLERKSVFYSYFDSVVEDERWNQATNEQGNVKMIQEACQILLNKTGLNRLDIDFFLAGDLVNQMTPTNFAAREIAASFIGLFSACATSVSSVIVACLLTELGASQYAIAGASSHHNAIERQFRYPIYYGSQKPATAQWTVTAAGFTLIGKHNPKNPSIVAATVGKVIDYGQKDPFHMGAAMAPAAYDTISRHLEKRKQQIKDYDLIMTGDLGKIGLQILKKMFAETGATREECNIFRDAGAEFYGEDPSFLAGASGSGCSASVYFSYVLQQLKSGRFKRVLLVATGSLHSPLTFQQGESIPCTAHAIEVTME